jgi:hypothetical protein
MFRTSSISTGLGFACVSGTVLPSGQPRFEVPLVSSTYLRPRAERGRMMTVESIGSGLTVVSSLSPSCAVTVPLAWRTGSIESTTPTRVPPRRTSLPFTRFAELGTLTFSE